MHNFKNLDVWKKAIELNKIIYKITRDFPKEEIYGATSQVRRSSVSISSNIAEGSSRRSNKDFIRFLEIALGSAFETENILYIAKEVEFLNENIFTEIEPLIHEIQKNFFGS